MQKFHFHGLVKPISQLMLGIEGVGEEEGARTGGHIKRCLDDRQIGPSGLSPSVTSVRLRVCMELITFRTRFSFGEGELSSHYRCNFDIQ